MFKSQVLSFIYICTTDERNLITKFCFGTGQICHLLQSTWVVMNWQDQE